MTRPLHYAHVDHLEIAYAWNGEVSPSPLVFLHGLGDSAVITFRRTAEHHALAAIPALLIDLPGFGYSPAPDGWPSTTEQQANVISGLLDTLGVSNTPIMGHSMGGSIAILVAHHRPDLVSRLILAEPLLQPEQSTLGKAIAKRAEAAFVARGYEMLQLATRRQALRGEKAAVGFQEALSLADPATMHKSASSLLQKRSPSLQAILERLTLPRTLLIGEHTAIDTRDLASRGISIVRIPNAGHSMMSDNPDAFAHAIANASKDDGARRTGSSGS